LGLTNVVVAVTEKEMGRDLFAQYRSWATPEGMIELLRMLDEGRELSAPNRNALLRLLTETPHGPRRIKGLLPAETPVAHKTGSSGTANGLTPATNDAGIVTLPDGRRGITGSERRRKRRAFLFGRTGHCRAPSFPDHATLFTLSYPQAPARQQKRMQRRRF